MTPVGAIRAPWPELNAGAAGGPFNASFNLFCVNKALSDGKNR